MWLPRFSLVFVALLGVLFPSRSTAVNAQDTGADDVIRWVVTFKEGTLLDRVDTLLTAAGIDIPDVALTIPELLIRVFMMDARIAKLVSDLPFVEYVERDAKVKLITPVSINTTDVLPSRGGARQGEYTPYGIEMVQALQVEASNVGNQKVCVIDSGYDINHEDLPGTGQVTGSDDIGVQPWFQDDNSHGTHVTGTIAAVGNNGLGVMSVTGNGQLPIHIVRIFDESGESFSSDTVADVQACINAGANIVSMSFGRSDEVTIPLGFGGPLAFEQQAFDRFLSEGILLIAAAGNDGSDSYSWPASYDSVMSVAAVNEGKRVASFSQSNDAVDICAPGVQVASTVPDNFYAFYDGTSMATPHVSGVAALVWSNFPDKTAEEIWQALISSAEDLGPTGRDDSYGFGLVQAAAASDFLASGGSVAAPTASPPTPTPVAEECVDDPTWTDPWGDSCDWYSGLFVCQAFGPLSSNDGQTAFEACCSCGGGSSLLGGNGEPTAAPTTSTGDTPSGDTTSDAPTILSWTSFFALFGLTVAVLFH